MSAGTKSSFFKGSLITILFVFVPFMAQSASMITSLDFRINPTAQTAKIGDTIHFNMAVIEATQTYLNVTNVVSVSTTSIVISSMLFPAIEPTFVNPLYVFDGARTWRVTNYTNTAIRSVTLSNSNLIAGFSLSNYNILEHADFRGASGVMASGGQASVAIGSILPNLLLYDDGSPSNNDATADDGVYNCVFEVRESYKFNLFGGNVDGSFRKSGNSATNAPFMAPLKINIDGIRPFVLGSYTTPGVFNPAKDVMQIFYGLSESGKVDIAIYYNSVTIRTMTAGGNFQYNNFPFVWDGFSNTGSVQSDGRYVYELTLTDAAGNKGIAHRGIVIVTTVEVENELHVVDPIYSHGGFDEMIASLTVKQRLKNATRKNLQNLGFDFPYNNTFTYSSDYRNYPYLMAQIRIYNSAGQQIMLVNNDADPLSDRDRVYVRHSMQPRLFDEDTGVLLSVDPMFNPYWEVEMCGATNTTVYMSPDYNRENDFDNVFFNPPIYQGNGEYYREYRFSLYSESYMPGTYFFGVRSKLAGKDINVVTEVAAVNTICEEPFFAYNTHAAPDLYSGLGLISEQSFVGFIVEPRPGGTVPDTIPPKVVAFSEYPSAGTIVELGEINTANYLKVTISDAGVGPGSSNLSSIVLIDPNGSAVPGKKAWNGGTAGSTIWELYYIPDNPLTLGGQYTCKITPVDGANNVGQEFSFTFSVLDPNIPVSDVTVVSASGGFVKLSRATSHQVNFLVSRIKATLVKGSSVDVDWQNSTVTVRNEAGQPVSGTAAHITGTNIIEFRPSVSIKDGKYTVYVNAVSLPAGGKVYTAVYSYRFYVTTAGNHYVNLSGTGENSETYMRIASFSESVSGIYASGVEIAPADIRVNTVSASAIYPPPTGYMQVGNVVTFSAPGYSLPLTFNSNYCEVAIRMHYTQEQRNGLAALNLTERDLTLWRWDGTSAWVQIHTISAPVSVGTDNYLEAVISEIPGMNQFAIMRPFTPAGGGGGGGGGGTVIEPIVRFDNTKFFNPDKGFAKIYYADSLAEIGVLGGPGNVEASIYSVSGQKIRYFEYQNPAETHLFTGSDANPFNALEVKFYIMWDGRNDKGVLVRNGMYMMKIKIKKASGETQTISRLLAVVK